MLWILGSWSPLPKKLSWRSAQAEDIVAQSQEVLADSSAKLSIGFFRALTLMPALLRARKNADGEKLEDVLPAELYARWIALKEKYIGHDNGVERLRPMLAANELYRKAIDRSGLTNANDAWDVIKKAAHKHHVRITTPEAEIPVDDPKQALKDFESTARELDVACLAKTIERLETDLDAMRQRANAWAIGDIEGLNKLPYPDQRSACLDAVASTPRMHELMEQARKRWNQAWLDAAEHALKENRSTFAVTSIAELLKPEGRLAQLRAKGYAIEAPE